ncbi:hypothetical protein C0995_001046, partial [Termitomyces sp. Mi166
MVGAIQQKIYIGSALVTPFFVNPNVNSARARASKYYGNTNNATCSPDDLDADENDDKPDHLHPSAPKKPNEPPPTIEYFMGGYHHIYGG